MSDLEKKSQGSVFQHDIRVRYAETDAQGVAHHSAYVVWLEAARIEALRELGWNYRELEANGLFMPVIEVSIRYRRSSQFDDELRLETMIAQAGPGRVRFETTIKRAETVLATATVAVAAVDANGRPQRLPEPLRTAIAAVSPEAEG